MTPPDVPKVCRECLLFRRYSEPKEFRDILRIESYCDASRPCAALELLRELVRTGELQERLRKEVG